MMQSKHSFFSNGYSVAGWSGLRFDGYRIVAERVLPTARRVGHRSDTPMRLLLRVKFAFLLIHSLMSCRVNRLLKRF